MGMFDFIEFEATCPCGEVITDWQSKDGPCELGLLKPLMVSNFYASCKNCGRWHDYHRSMAAPELPEFGSMDDFAIDIKAANRTDN